ncbi:glycoside hydrolase family 24 protein [Chryseobacterium taichungense]|uniref:glycoside hydrolase family 24 protein n=1 Tax=Chryseobacterium taichungense TaxID=295069 RepID=UPI0028A599EA|nr:glycoside hydrolase family 104 protein [Chryseobacterium taichungense]
MAKKGISKIKGPEEIHLGETVYYEVSRLYDLNDTEKIGITNWKIYVQDKGSFRELRQKPGMPPKKGYKIPLTINNQKLVGKEILIEAYLYEPEKSAPPGLKVKVLPGRNKKIDRVELFMRDDTRIKENTVLKYGQSIKVKVYTQNMPGEKIKLSLYEDDVNGPGHSTKNEKNKVASITRHLNKDGFLWHEFKLPVEFSKIANAVMDGSHDKIHEYYVVAETAQHKSVSKNAEVKNPDYIFTQTVSSSIDPNKIYGKEILIEEVVIKGKYKKQVGVDAMEKSGRSTVEVKAPPAVKQDDKNEVCECEARVRAFMRMIRKGEGTIDEGGYSRIVGGSKFSNFKSHPKIYIKEHNSTAAGAYQITLTNWDSENFSQWRSDNKVEDFSPESQDIYCAYLLIKKKRAFNDIKNNDLEGAINKCAKEWASLPGAGYGQREESIETVKKLYNKFLNEELTGQEGSIAKLHIKPGFLKKYFGYNCCEENNDSKQITKKKYDIDKAVAKINSNVEPKSISACAKYVRIAIEAGGLSTNGRPISAKNYDVFLPKLGVTQISTENYTPKKGDISVIQSIANHPHGHICMYNGSQWVSDFKQIDMWPGPRYRKNPPRYNIFRWK